MSSERVAEGAGGSIAAAIRVSGVGTVEMRYAVQHLLGAASFSRRVGEIERAHVGEQFGPFFDDILHSATASILLTVASLESSVNELFADREKVFAGHSAQVLDVVWGEFERKAVLEKFDLALALRGAEKISRGTAPGQGVDALIRLRNALVHFKPEPSNEDGQHAELSRRLHETHRSPFLKEKEPLFPRAWASHACTRWAVEQAIAFDTMVARRLGVDARYAKHVARLGA